MFLRGEIFSILCRLKNSWIKMRIHAIENWWKSDRKLCGKLIKVKIVESSSVKKKTRKIFLKLRRRKKEKKRGEKVSRGRVNKLNFFSLCLPKIAKNSHMNANVNFSFLLPTIRKHILTVSWIKCSWKFFIEKAKINLSELFKWKI